MFSPNAVGSEKRCVGMKSPVRNLWVSLLLLRLRLEDNLCGW